jgi:hypothetical protein
MFIPRGKAVHENLSTSYVLIGPMIDDLCEGGFSGIVEVTLRQLDGCVIIDHGKVLASVERSPEAEKHPGCPYSPIALDALGERARQERGRVSVYSHSAGIASAIAGRLLAEPLYVGLSTDFADLDKMIGKLRRESDRQWFIEVSTSAGAAAMIHIRRDRCRIIEQDMSSAEADTGDLDPADNKSLRLLLDECSSGGGVFDVYYLHLAREEYPAPSRAVSEAVELEPVFEEPEPIEVEEAEPIEIQEPEPVAAQEPVIEVEEEKADLKKADMEMDLLAEVRAFASTPAVESQAEGEEIESREVEEEEEPAPPEPPRSQGALAMGLSANTMRLLSLVSQGEAEGEVVAENAEEMAEVKRLMGEIARTIESATKEVEPGDSFSIYLRAGQLKVADRYPFLDPFGAEFEYLGGEIAFVGRSGTQDFIEGLTEALRHAVAGVVQTSVQPTRLRIYIVEDLRQLLTRSRAEFEKYGLDKAVEDIINF